MDTKLSLVPDDFLDRIKNNPNSIFNDFEIRLAVDALRIYAKDGTQSESARAREILKDAKIKNFIDERAHHNKTDDPNLRYWQTNIDIFLHNIIEMETQAKPIWEKDKYKKKNKVPVTTEILTELTGEVPDVDYVKKIIEGERGMQLPNLLLSIFADKNDIDYYSLRNFYNRPDVKEKKKRLLSLIENNYSELELIPLDSHLNSSIDSAQISENPELGVQAQKEAYVEYIKKKFASEDIPSYSFFWKLLELANE